MAKHKVDQNSGNKPTLSAILKLHQTNTGPLVNSVGHVAGQGIESQRWRHAEADTALRRGSTQRRMMTHLRPAVRMRASGHDQVPGGKEKGGGARRVGDNRSIMETQLSTSEVAALAHLWLHLISLETLESFEGWCCS